MPRESSAPKLHPASTCESSLAKRMCKISGGGGGPHGPRQMCGIISQESASEALRALMARTKCIISLLYI